MSVSVIEFVREVTRSGRPMWAALGSSPPRAVAGGGGDDMNATTITVDMMSTNIDELAIQEERLALLEKDFDRAPTATDTIPAAAPEDCVAVAPAIPRAPLVPVIAEPVTPATFVMPPTEYMHRGRRYELVCEGVCVSCARCGMALTDSVSIERGLGPDCSRKGYDEDPKNADEMQAFIDLAEYPTLAEYLAAKYKPLGVRALMNGLVKIASLNRRSPGLHSSICDAIDSLGYKVLAGSLRDSIATIEIKQSTKRPDHYQVWVKKGEWTFAWSSEMKRISNIGGWGRMPTGDNKGVLIPKTAKRALWEAMLRFYPGHIAKTPEGTIKVERRTVDANKEPSA